MQNLISRTIQGEEVILDLNRGCYYSLNEVGTQIWLGLQSGKEVHTIASDLCQMFEVEPEVAMSDVVEFVARLKAQSLLS